MIRKNGSKIQTKIYLKYYQVFLIIEKGRAQKNTSSSRTLESGACKSMKNAKDEIASDDRNDKMGHNTATL